MLTDISQTKRLQQLSTFHERKPQKQSNPQGSPILQEENQLTSPVTFSVNPIVKHTYQSLPRIYGANNYRKKKYNLSYNTVLSKKERYKRLSSLVNEQKDKSYTKHHCWNTNIVEIQLQKLKLKQIEKHRGNTSMSLSKKFNENNADLEQNIRRTEIKKPKNLQNLRVNTAFNLNQQRIYPATTKAHSQNFNLQLIHLLAKPKQKCTNKYCSCKSLYEEYEKQIKSKFKNHKSLPKKLKRLQNESNNEKLCKLHGQDIIIYDNGKFVNLSKKNKMKTVGDEEINQGACPICEQIKEKSQKLAKLRPKQVAVQFSSLIDEATQTQPYYISCDFAAQANISTPKNHLDQKNQQTNTPKKRFQFKYLQNRPKVDQKQSQLLRQNQNIKKQPLQHLFKLKEQYKNKRRNSTKYKNLQELEKNKNKKVQCQVKGTQTVNENQHSTESMDHSSFWQNSFLNHLTNALSKNSNNIDKTTIFHQLTRQQNEDSFSEQKKTVQHSEKGNLIDSRGLFTIPQQEEYTDYLKNYKPILKNFNIKKIMRSENFRILKFKDALYFGQVKSQKKLQEVPSLQAQQKKPQLKNGKGLYITPTEIFEGTYKDGIKIQGCQRNIDGFYIGQFIDGKRHGNGKFFWNNGEVFQGQWKLGTKNGFGIWKSPKGDSYEGQWVLNRQHGQGVYRHKNSVYQGEFKDFLKCGQGKQVFRNGDQYIGSYLQGKPHGKGRYIWKNGTFYEGQFVKGLREGYGIWYQSDQTKYEGQFKQDYKSGHGREISKDGSYFRGYFQKGEKISGTYFDAKGQEILNQTFQKEQQV